MDYYLNQLRKGGQRSRSEDEMIDQSDLWGDEVEMVSVGSIHFCVARERTGLRIYIWESSICVDVS